MNIEQAKTIQLYNLLVKMGYDPVSNNGNEYFFLSPWREEKIASFRLNIEKNLYFDFGENEGGDIVTFGCRYLQSCGKPCTKSDSLKWLGEQENFTILSKSPNLKKSKPKAKMILREVSKISNDALINYLTRRGISIEAAKAHLKELRIYFPENNSTMFVLGFKNDDRGYELRNQTFKGTFPPKGITFIRGTIPKPPNIHIFEGIMDYLTFLTRLGKINLTDDTIILNSTNNVSKVKPYIYLYEYEDLRSWMDNDKAGRKARKALDEMVANENGLNHLPMNALYKGYSDFNEFHMAKLGLPPLPA